MVEFIVNNKVHSATKVSLFKTNYGRELKIGADIKKKGKDNGIYKEDKEGTERSRDNIRKSTREDKATDKQRVKES